MAGVIPIIDTAYDMVMDMSVRVVQKLIELFTQDTVFIETRDSVGRVESTEAGVVMDTTPVAISRTGVHGKHTVMYALMPKTPLYQNPTIAFDSQIAAIPYGALVLVMEPQGRFYRVVWNAYEGWILKENLADRASSIYPTFVHGEENSVDHPNTARVRALIEDAFGLSQSEFPLQAGEYVLYKLFRRGTGIAWPLTRPRMPGSWHKILRGVPGVHMGVTPKAGTILEYTAEHEVGHLAYVEAVFPDSTITISEANYPHSGIYSERALTKDAWRALKPVFIEVDGSQKT